MSGKIGRNSVIDFLIRHKCAQMELTVDIYVKSEKLEELHNVDLCVHTHITGLLTVKKQWLGGDIVHTVCWERKKRKMCCVRQMKKSAHHIFRSPPSSRQILDYI